MMKSFGFAVNFASQTLGTSRPGNSLHTDIYRVAADRVIVVYVVLMILDFVPEKPGCLCHPGRCERASLKLRDCVFHYSP